jgi:16S rRNA (uracil1498-N3)-methyltransferase
MIRLLLPGASEGPAPLSGERFHYVTRVLRLRADDSLEVFDGKGRRFDAKVTSLTESEGVLKLENGRAEPALRAVTIVQGLPKGDKLELVLQKGTELGATRFAPAMCERSVVKLDGKQEAKRARWQRIAEEAARQCGRSDVPEVMTPAPLVALVRALPDSPRVLVLDEEERAVPLSQAAQAAGERPLALVIGPEGGLARGEVDALLALGAQPVTLGRLILRTETAALAALAVLRHLEGALG